MNSISQKAKDIFVSLVEDVPQGEWDDRVEEACQGDVELQRRVQALLVAHAHPDSRLEQAAIDFPITQEQSATDQAILGKPGIEKPGVQIGPYKLLQQIGEGGMGVVYMAEQKEPVKRSVAQKIIKPGMDTRQVIARFEAERQALAMMDHPNIAKVLDAGATESGRPYFVMELVNGLPVTQYCDEQHLTPAERLELFVPICKAVQHAHQKGIIHRDLKPSNVLVALYDGQAVPKVIDFGVAKATSHTLTEKTMFTQLGQIVGTLEYMSPEQAQRNQLDVDTRSDIYSLGVVLYELLTGEIPFDRKRLRSAAFDEVLRMIREEDPSKPSTKVSNSQALPSIAANRRMEPSRLGKMIRGELDWIVMRAMEKDRARRYETASEFAEDVENYLAGDAVEACPPSASYRLQKFVRRNVPAIATATFVATALVAGTALSVWQSGVARRAAAEAEFARAETQRRLSEVRQANEMMGAIFEELDVAEMSDEERRRPLETVLTERLASVLKNMENASFSDPKILADMQHRLASSLYLVRQYEESVALAQKALAGRRATMGTDHADTFATMKLLGWGYYSTRRPRLAIEVFEELLGLEVTKLGPAHLETCQTRDELAHVYRNTKGEGESEIRILEQQIEVASQEYEAKHQVVVHATGQLARAYSSKRKDAQRGIALLMQALRAHNSPKYMYELGELHRWNGEPDKALPFNKKALEICEQLHGPDAEQTYKNAISLAQTYRDLGRLDEAISIYEPALEGLKKHFGPNISALVWPMIGLAHTYEASGDIELATPLYEHAFQTYFSRYGLENPAVRRFAANLCRVYVTMNRWDDAIAIDNQMNGTVMNSSGLWLQMVGAVLRNGAPSTFEQACKRMAVRFRDTDDVETAERVCRVCLLRPDVVSLDQLPRRVLIDSLTDNTTAQSVLPWQYSACGLLAYREGDAEQALWYARESQARVDDVRSNLRPEYIAALNLGVIAMAAKDLGQSEAAQSALREASQLFDRMREAGLSRKLDIVMANVIYQEAMTKIGVEAEVPTVVPQ